MNQAPPIWTEEPISYLILFALVIVQNALIPSVLVALGFAVFATPKLAAWRWWTSILAISLVCLNHLLSYLLNTPLQVLPIVPVIGWVSLIVFSVGLTVSKLRVIGISRDVWTKIWAVIATLYTVLLLPIWSR
jgi:hypothetical protein